MKKIALIALIIAVALLGLSSCKEDTSGALAGTWFLNSTETSGNVAAFLGDGSFNITYLTSTSFPFLGTFEFYEGSGNINGVDYLVDATYSVDLQAVQIKLYQSGEDPNVDYIDLQVLSGSYSGGDSLNGTYEGEGLYADAQGQDIDSGTFTATRS
jgi:hypothetical protein